ncbi:MAG: hypothetical protein E6J85_01835, partial [Deltaproteobacteria bacterium]
MRAVLSRRSEGRPRIALVLPGLGSGGLERVVADLARALPGRGYAAGVFCTSKLGVHADALRRAGIPVWNCRDPSFRIPGLPIRLIARLRGFCPSIVHAQSGDGRLRGARRGGPRLHGARARSAPAALAHTRGSLVCAPDAASHGGLDRSGAPAPGARRPRRCTGRHPQRRRPRIDAEAFASRGARRAGAVRRVARALGRTARIDQEPCVAHRGALASRRCSPGARSDRRQGHGQRRRPFLELLHGLEVVGVRELDPLLAEKLDDSTL